MNSSSMLKSIHHTIPLKISSILIVAEWSPMTFSTDALTRMCELDSREANSKEDKDEEQCPDSLTVTRAVNTNKSIIEIILFL